MYKEIGNVKIEYMYYGGNDIYSDGKIEDVILEACINGDQEELLKTSSDYAVLYHLSNIRENLLDWISIDKSQNVLEIGSGCGALTGVLAKKSSKVTCIELSEKRSLINAYRHRGEDNIEILLGNFQDIEPSLQKYDVITLIGVLEYSQLYINDDNPFHKMLEVVKKHLNKNGKIIIAIENKMGLKYWNGACEDHIGKPYFGIHNYSEESGTKVRTFSKNELINLLNDTGISDYDFYYPLPDYKLPNIVFSDNYLPHTGEIRQFGMEYAFSRLYNFNEALVYDQICSDGMFDYFANSFLVICGGEERTVYAKYNRERKIPFRTKTLIQNNNNFYSVKKLYFEKTDVINKTMQHLEWDVFYKKINRVEMKLIEGGTVSEYVKGASVCEELCRKDISLESIVTYIKELKDEYFDVSDDLEDGRITDEFIKVFGNIDLFNFKTLKLTNIDLIPGNIKINENGEWFAYDSEWVFDFPIPYQYVYWRFCKVFYDQNRAYMKNKCSKEVFLEKIGYTKQENAMFDAMENNFTEYVVGKNHMEEYTKHYQKSGIMQRITYY